MTEPSKANYEPKHLAWMIELFGACLGVDQHHIGFRYSHSKDKEKDTYVWHPQDKSYMSEVFAPRVKSPEQERYEEAAKKSVRLHEFAKKSNVEYWQPRTPRPN